MRALLHYLHVRFMKSYRYAAPTVIYVLGIIFVYSVVPNPVMESYAFSAAFLFVAVIAIGAAVIDLEGANQEMVTTLHAGSLGKLYLAKLLYSWCFALPLGGFAVVYPAMFGKFDRFPLPDEWVMAIGVHAAAAWLGVSLACWFTVKLFRSRLISLLGLSVVAVCALSSFGIGKLLPKGWAAASFLLPPMGHTIAAMIDYGNASVMAILSAVGSPLLYGAISMLLFMTVMIRRKLG